MPSKRNNTKNLILNWLKKSTTQPRKKLVVNLRAMMSKYADQTKAELEKVFQEADKSGAVLWLDEADAIFGKRTDIQDAHDKYANLETSISELLKKYPRVICLNCIDRIKS